MFADRTKLIDASGIRKIWAKAASLKDPIDFSIGQPDFDVPSAIKEAAVSAIRFGANRYTLTAGDPQLCSKLAGKLAVELGWKEPAVLVTCGVSGGLLLAFLAIINPGDEVIIIDPYFVIYKHLVHLLGGKCVFVDSYPDFRLPIRRIAQAISPATKLIVINSPANPTGAVYTEQEIKMLAQIAGQNDLLVISDEIYNQFCYDLPQSRCPSIASYHPKTLVLRGFSKTYGMPGWRLGYAAAGQQLQQLVEHMTVLQQYTFVCAPAPLQKAAIAALDADVSALISSYKLKRDLVYEGLKDKFELTKPAGAFYAFIKAPSGSGTEFVEKALANNVLVIPGGVFSEKDTHFRLSFSTSDEKIRQGIEILRKLV